MMDSSSDDKEGALPPGDPPQLIPPNAANPSPEQDETAQRDAASLSPIELDAPSGDVDVSPEHGTAIEAHRWSSEFVRASIGDIESQRTGTSGDAETIPVPGLEPRDHAADPTEQERPGRGVRDLLHRLGDEPAGRFEQLPDSRPEQGGPPAKIQYLSEAGGESTAPTDSVEPPSGEGRETASEAALTPALDVNVPPQAFAAPPASRSVRLPFPGESLDEAPDTFEGLVELHKRQSAAPESAPSASSPASTSPSEPSPPATHDPSRPEYASPGIADDSSLHTMPQVLVTVSLLDAERLVSEEFRSMADEHAAAMRQIASEELDEYNFKFMAELRAVFGR